MPYKSKEQKREYNNWWREQRQLDIYRLMGLEPIDINDPRSPLECQSCRKVTPRNCPHRFRHESDCEKNSIVTLLVGSSKKRWSRRKVILEANSR